MKKNLNKRIVRECFGYQNPSFLTKDLLKASQTKNYQMVNVVNDALIDLRNAANNMEIPEN